MKIMAVTTYYIAHVEVERNIGNYKHEVVFRTMKSAKEFQTLINNYHSCEDRLKRDSTVYRISVHNFRNADNISKFEWENSIFD